MVNMRAGWCSAPPRIAFPREVIYLGDEVSAQDPEGQVRHGRITEVNPDEVVVDFNHMLAGKTLNFSITVGEIRDASEEEIAHGHVHGPGGHHHH